MSTWTGVNDTGVDLPYGSTNGYNSGAYTPAEGNTPRTTSNGRYMDASYAGKALPGYDIDYVDIYYAWVEDNFDDPVIIQELKNNPYINQKLPVYFMDFSGAKSQAWLNNFNTQVNEYVQKVVEKYKNRSYDSPVASVARDQAAGINDRLTGKPTEAGNGITSGNDENPGSAPEPESAGEILFGDLLPAALNVVMSFSQTISALKTQRMGRSMQKLEMLKFGTDVFNNALAGSSSVPKYNKSSDQLAEDLSAAVGEGYMDDEDGLGQHIIDSIKNAYTSAHVTQKDQDGNVIKSLNELYDDPYLKAIFKQLSGRLSYDAAGNRTLGLEKAKTGMIKEFLEGKKGITDVLGSGYYDDDVSRSADKLIDTYTNLDIATRRASAQIAGVQAEIAEVQKEIVGYNKTVAANQAEASQYLPDNAAANLRISEANAASAETQSAYQAEVQSPDVAKAEARMRKLEAKQRSILADLDVSIDESFDQLVDYANEHHDVVLKAAVVKLRADAHAKVNQWKTTTRGQRVAEEVGTITDVVGALTPGKK